MKNILIVNHKIKNCGVYQYGYRFSNILVKSKKYNFVYVETENPTEFNAYLERYKPNAIIYNYVGSTMPWLNPSIVNELRGHSISQFLIVHTSPLAVWNGQFYYFDYYLHQNPYHPNIDSRNFPICRPLFEFSGTENLNPKLTIGTFGFGFHHKNVQDICKIVNEQFDCDVLLNLHLTLAHFGDNGKALSEIPNLCRTYITKSNIHLNITNNFLTDEELLSFLYNNDLNIFLYDKYNDYNGISSCIDYALSVKKPIAVSESNMFSHINHVNPSICIEKNTLQNIINNGFHDQLQQKYESWTHEKFIDNVENIMQSVQI